MVNITIFAPMKRKIARYITQHCLLNSKGTVIIALSGGADSVALLSVLHALNYNCHAVHCNFHLRGEESTRDELFVRGLCDKQNIPLSVTAFDTEQYARNNSLSIEMAARELRYNLFEEMRIKLNAQAIAVAHHRDDSAETVLLNLIRGTGLKGLHGIRPRNGYIVRPLLCVGRNEILKYLEEYGIDFVTDSTNMQTDYTRNKIRLELLPLMKQINPSILQSIAATADRIAEAESIYKKAVDEAIGRVKCGNEINIEKLILEPAPETLLHEILSPLGFNSKQTADIYSVCEAESGKIFESEEWMVLKDRREFIIHPKASIQEATITLPEEGCVTTANGILELKKEEFNGTINKSRNIAVLDYDTLKLPLILRKTQKGDKFIPLGMKGKKLVSDYLTDRKYSLIEKREQYVIADANGNIVWLVNERPAAQFCISERTHSVLSIEWKR